MRAIENLPTADGDKPTKDAVIADCGQLTAEEALGSGDGTKKADAYGDIYEDYPEDDAAGPPGAAKCLEVASACKDYGNAAFKAGDLAAGLSKYEKGLRYLDEDPDWSSVEGEENAAAKAAQLRFVLNNNSALLNLRMGAYKDAERNASAALDVVAKGIAAISDADKAKALFRRGSAFVKLRDEDAALRDLEEAAKLAPNDAAVLKELTAVKKTIAARIAKEKATLKKFFDSS